jgi:hypothetical protein
VTATSAEPAAQFVARCWRTQKGFAWVRAQWWRCPFVWSACSKRAVVDAGKLGHSDVRVRDRPPALCGPDHPAGRAWPAAPGRPRLRTLCAWRWGMRQTALLAPRRPSLRRPRRQEVGLARVWCSGTLEWCHWTSLRPGSVCSMIFCVGGKLIEQITARFFGFANAVSLQSHSVFERIG